MKVTEMRRNVASSGQPPAAGGAAASRVLAPASTSGGTEDRDGASHRGVFDRTDSPCVAVCSTLYDEICRGCGRTAMEVANWVFFDDDEKREIWQRITAQGYPRRKG